MSYLCLNCRCSTALIARKENNKTNMPVCKVVDWLFLSATNDGKEHEENRYRYNTIPSLHFIS